MIETTNLEQLARLLYGELRAAELMSLAVNLLAGLKIVAEAGLSGAQAASVNGGLAAKLFRLQ